MFMNIRVIFPLIAIWLLVLPPKLATALDNKSGTLQEMIQYGMQGTNGAVTIKSLSIGGKDSYIIIRSFFDSTKPDTDEGSYMPWRLLKRDDKTGDYELYASGDYIETLMSLDKANPSRKFGMPGSGFPRGIKKGEDIIGTDVVRLAANKELGDCDDVPYLHCKESKQAYVILVSKDSGKWIIVEVAPNLEEASYLDRGEESHFMGVPRSLAFGVKPNAKPPRLADDISAFDDYYGQDGQDRSKNPKPDPLRAWLRDNYIIAYGDQRPKSVFVSTQKITGEAFNKGEVFDIANSLSGNVTWVASEENDDSSQFRSNDGKYSLTWLHKKQVPGSVNQPQLVAVELDLSQSDTTGNPAAPKPMLYDDPQVFENFYGQVKVSDIGWAKVRIWGRGNFVITHMDCRPQRLMIDIHKIDHAELSETEVFDIADRYCGKLKWNSKGQTEKSTAYESDDKKYILNWFKNDFINPQDSSLHFDHVTLTYTLPDKNPDKSIDKL
jgi:hypothetical protein